MLKTTFASLKYRNFRYFWIGQCVSLMGTWIQKTALVWLVYTLTKSPLLVGILGVCQFAPMLMFTLFAGVFIDHFPKKNILIMTQSVFMILGFIMTALNFLGIVKYWEILVIITIFGLSQTFDTPARQSFFIELVGKKDVMNGISLNSTIFNLAKIVGPAISGIVMVKLGVTFCFLIDAVSYIAVIFGLIMIRTDPVVHERVSRHVIQEIKEGLSYIRQNETLVINVLLMTVVCTFAMNTDVIIPVFAKTVLNGGAGVYTGLMSAAGIGSFIAAIVMATAAKNGIRKNVFITAGVATSLMQVLMLFARDFRLAVVMVAVVGFLNLVFLNLCNSIFQINTADGYRGRVMSVYSFLNQGSTPIGNFYSGSVMNVFSGISGFPACGAASIILLIPIIAIKRKTIASWLGR